MAKKLKVLVSGGAGFIGSHTADLLLKKGYEVVVMDNLSAASHNGKWPSYLDKRVKKIKGDVFSKSDWEKALKGVAYVIHLAALMDILPEFSRFFKINAVGTANLFEVIVAKNLPIKKVVVASSQFVYGQGGWKCEKHGEVYPTDRDDKLMSKKKWDPSCTKCNRKIVYIGNHEDHVDPPNQYAISKYAGELIGLKLGKIYNIPTTALRYSIVHGSRQSVRNLYSGALRIFVIQALKGKNLTLFEDGKMLRDFVSVKDVARANVLVMRKKESDFKSFNVGGGKGYTISELAEIVLRQLNKDVGIEVVGEYRVGDIRHAVSDISALRKLGWEPKTSEEKSVDDFIKWATSQSIDKIDIDGIFKQMKAFGTLKQSQ